MSVSERVYRWLLRLYPRDFREEYGPEMAMLFRDRTGEGRLRLWIQVLGDLLFHAPREHLSLAAEDARYALRAWRGTPAIPILALTALAFGIGANVAIFSVVHAVMLDPVPVPEPGRLIVVREIDVARDLQDAAVSLPNYLSWREQSRSLDLAAFSGQSLTWTGAEYPERVEALAPTESFAAVLAAPLQMGRWFTADESRPGQHRVAVLSHRLWRTRFGGDRAVLERKMVLNGAPYAIVGVASPEWSIPSEPDLWVPQVVDPVTARRGNRYLSVLGRIRPGFTPQQAQSEMIAIAAALEREFPDSNRGYGARVIPLSDSLVPGEIRAALTALLAAAGMVLLIACANVASVLLSRTVARRRELSVRLALGASAARLTRQLLTESLLLSAGAAALGVLMAAGSVAAARGLLADVVPRIDHVALNLPVLLFAVGLAVLTGLAFGLAPLAQVGRARSVDLLHAAGRVDRPLEANRARAALVFGQVALITVLLAAAGLLTQSLARLQRVPSGIDAESVLTAKLSLTRARLADGAAIGDFLSRLTGDLRGAAGVIEAGVSSAIPLSPGALTITRAAAGTGPFAGCEWRLVDAGYFRTLSIPLVRGRLFEAQDGATSPRVFVLSQQMARALYGDADPIGQRLRLENGASGEVIGVVADVRMRNLGEPPERVVYFPPSQFGFFPLFNVVVRSEGLPEAAAALVRDRLKAHDPALAAYEIRPMRHWVDRSAALMRIRTRLVALLGALALLLGVIGVYGVMACVVAQRTREFGIRMALGARPRVLPLGVVAQALRYTLPGILCGLVVVLLIRGAIRPLLFDIDPADPLTLAVVAGVVALIAALASYVPARRAAAADPLVVLRAE